MTARIQEFGDERPGVLRWICHDHAVRSSFGRWITDRNVAQHRANHHNEHAHSVPPLPLDNRELWSALNDCWGLLTHEQIEDLTPEVVDLCRKAHTIIDHPDITVDAW